MNKRFDHEFLKQRRREKNVSQETLAMALGFKNSSTYSKYENGDTAVKADMLPIIANVLKTPIASFFTAGSSEIEHNKQPEEVS
ncbi:transcriptional regulator [Levilactobacillus brevis]|uniref:helix-turn-helix domain-containing protein n=1 Tax=Levilactobacillus brevis TaxID=1580 RepID=UPI000C1B46C9|nr:helix-turn-helix transcriptional regulator [Levilactobacillus brevis]ATU71054.1 transcriptional regulator [Levilactobacillus brevis]